MFAPSACLCFHLSVECVVPPLPPLQAYRHNPPYFPINEFGLLFSIIGGTLGIGVAVAVGILFAVQVCVCEGGGGTCAVKMCILNLIFNTTQMVVAGLNLQVVFIDRGSV